MSLAVRRPFARSNRAHQRFGEPHSRGRLCHTLQELRGLFLRAPSAAWMVVIVDIVGVVGGRDEQGLELAGGGR